jgi:hypothetical protein
VNGRRPDWRGNRRGALLAGSDRSAENKVEAEGEVEEARKRRGGNESTSLKVGAPTLPME